MPIYFSVHRIKSEYACMHVLIDLLFFSNVFTCLTLCKKVVQKFTYLLLLGGGHTNVSKLSHMFKFTSFISSAVKRLYQTESYVSDTDFP